MKRTAIMIPVIIVVLIGMAAKLPAAERTITTYTNAGGISGTVPERRRRPSPSRTIWLISRRRSLVRTSTKPAPSPLIPRTRPSVWRRGNDTSGSLWYQGNNDIAYCVNGACDFGGGLRPIMILCLPRPTAHPTAPVREMDLLLPSSVRSTTT